MGSRSADGEQLPGCHLHHPEGVGPVQGQHSMAQAGPHTDDVITESQIVQ